MLIYDAHTHIFPDKIAEKATASIGAFYESPMYSPAATTRLLEAENAAGISRCLVCSSAVTAGQVESINTFIAGECAAHPEFLGFAAMHPDYENIAEELDRAVSLGLHGVKFHPDFQKFDIDDPKALPMYREIAKRGLPVLFHTGDNRYDYSAPTKVQTVMRQIPDLVCIGAHFGGYRRWDEALSLDKNPNLYFDTSSSLTVIDRDLAKRMIDKFGPQQFLFGTDFPMWNPTEERERFFSLGLSDEENEQICHKTFERLFLK